jgi:hydroxypyruvate isomerase
MTVVPGHVDLRLDMGYQTAHVVESLKRACDVLEPHGLVMVLEPLNPRDHPGLFLKKIPQAYEICKAVGSPSCKILDDLYHQQITEGNLIPNIDAAWDEIAYFQIGDNPGRKEPTTGEINYLNVFKHIHARGFEGVMGMEHGNMKPGKEGERALIDAYLAVDSF